MCRQFLVLVQLTTGRHCYWLEPPTGGSDLIDYSEVPAADEETGQLDHLLGLDGQGPRLAGRLEVKHQVEVVRLGHDAGHNSARSGALHGGARQGILSIWWINTARQAR